MADDLPDRIEKAITQAESSAQRIQRGFEIDSSSETFAALDCAEQVLRAAEVDRKQLEWAQGRTGTTPDAVMLRLAACYGVTP